MKFPAALSVSNALIMNPVRALHPEPAPQKQLSITAILNHPAALHGVDVVVDAGGFHAGESGEAHVDVAQKLFYLLHGGSGLNF